jgi:O-antigen/teichoic acid export membrane protein
VALFSLGYFAVITRLFSKLDIAALAVVALVNAVGGGVGGMGLITLALQRVPGLRASGRQEEAARLLGLCTAYSIAGSVFVAVLVAAAARPLSLVFFKTATSSALISVAGVMLISYKACEAVNLSMQALDDFRMVTRMRLLNDIWLRLVGLPVYFLGGILGYLLALALGQLVLATAIIVVKRQQIALAGCLDWRLARLCVRQSLPFYGVSMSRISALQADSLLVGILLRPNALATYYVIRRFYDYLAMFYETMLTPLIPKIAERREYHQAMVADAFRKSSRYLLAIWIFTAIMLVPLSSQLLAVFGGSKYLDGLAGLRMLFLAAALYGLYNFHSSFILAAARPRDALSNEILMSLVNLGLCAWLVAAYGVTGGAAARAAATAIAAMTSFWILSRALSDKLCHDWDLLKRLLPVSFSGAGAIILAQVWVQNLMGVLLIWVGVLLLQLYWVIHANPRDVDFIINGLGLQRRPLVRRILKLVRAPC